LNFFYIKKRPLVIPLFYLAVFLGIEALDIFLPYSSVSKDLYSYFVYYSFNFSVFWGVLFFSFFSFPFGERLYVSSWVLKTSVFCFIVSLIGVSLIYLDRVYIQGVDYSQGVSFAREAWREQASIRGGVSSFYSVVGNLFFPFVYVSLIFSVIYGDYFKSSFWLFMLSIVIVLGFSLITGGREAVLVFVAFLVSSIAFRIYVGFSWLPRRLFFTAIFIVSLAFFYSVYISLLRAEGSGFDVDEYAYLTAEKLMGASDPGVLAVIPDSLAPVALYFVHVKWVFIDVASCGYCEGLSTFRLVYALFVGYLGELFGWGGDIALVEYYPNWISLNGSLYYDFGWFGVFLIVFPYFFLKIAIDRLIRVSEHRFNFFGVILYVFFIALIVFSPFAFLLEIVQFFYFFASLVVLLFLSFMGAVINNFGRSKFE
jgi:hypothetical protein